MLTWCQTLRCLTTASLVMKRAGLGSHAPRLAHLSTYLRVSTHRPAARPAIT